MILRVRTGCVPRLLAAVFFVARPAHATIDYTVSIAHPERHIFARDDAHPATCAIK